MRAIASGRQGQVRTSHTAGVTETVAGEAGGGAEDLTSLGEVAILESGLRRGAQFVEGPVLGRASSEHGSDVLIGGFDGRVLGERDELVILGQFLGRECRQAVVTNEFDELAETGATAIVGGLDEPVELGLAQGGVPASLQHAETAHDFHFRFLAAGLRDHGHGLGGDGGRLQERQRFGEEPVELEVRRGIGGVVLGDDRLDASGVRLAVAVQDDLGQTGVREFLLLVELSEVHAA